jgi:tetratricopeptide (TPR) repeat protein
MSSLFFWKTWDRSHRLGYLAGLFFVAVSLVLLGVAWLNGINTAIRWDVLSELTEVPVAVHTFSDGLLSYTAGGKAYTVSEQFLASAMQIHPILATVCLAGVALALVLILSALPRFDRLRYLIGMGVLIVSMAFFRWEMLEMPGLEGNTLFLILTVLFGGLSYYFHAFRSDLLIHVRLLAFSVLTAATVVAISMASPVAFPAMALLSYGMPVLLAISVGFIFFISAEIVAGLVWLTSTSRDQSRPSTEVAGLVVDQPTVPGTTLGTRNFLVITGLYLINLVLIWLKNTKLVEWDVLAISPFLLYLISAIVGIWGFRRLTEQQDVVSFRDGAAFLYAGLALLTTLTIGYGFATANDPITEMFEDVIVYTHLGMGLVFVVYVYINFWPIFKQHRAVYRILYKPKRLEFSLFRVVGFVLTIILLSTGGLIALRQAIAGYYNGLGDYYMVSGQRPSAEAFYRLALEQEFQNHKSNYSLASLAMQQDDQATASFYYQRATLKQPHPQDYVGLSQAYLQTSLFFEAVKALQQGIRTFPDNGELKNNLGFLYARTSVADSAYFYLKAASEQVKNADVPESNLLGFYARHPLVLSADSTLVQSVKTSDYASYQANALALRLVAPVDTTQPQRPNWLAATPAGEGLSIGRFANLYNYALASHQPDTVLTNRLRTTLTNPLNQDFTDELLLAQAAAEYKVFHPADAFALLAQLAENDQVNGPSYRQTAGIWMLEQGLYQSAADQFGGNNDTTSIYYRAIALTKKGDLPVAQSFWETAAKSDPAVAALKQVLYDERQPTTDIEKAMYVAYRTDNDGRGRYWETITDPSLKTVAGVYLTNAYLEQLQWRNAQLMLSGMPTKGAGPLAVSLRNVAAIRLSAFRRSVGSAETMAADSILPQQRAEADYWLGQTYERIRQPGKARQWFDRAFYRAPLSARVVTAIADQLQAKNKTKAAYDLVLSALPYNDDQPDLLRKYITLCLTIGLPDYADDALVKLQAASSPADYQAFLADYQKKIALNENRRRKFAE